MLVENILLKDLYFLNEIFGNFKNISDTLLSFFTVTISFAEIIKEILFGEFAFPFTINFIDRVVEIKNDFLDQIRFLQGFVLI